MPTPAKTVFETPEQKAAREKAERARQPFLGIPGTQGLPIVEDLRSVALGQGLPDRPNEGTILGDWGRTLFTMPAQMTGLTARAGRGIGDFFSEITTPKRELAERRAAAVAPQAPAAVGPGIYSGQAPQSPQAPQAPQAGHMFGVPEMVDWAKGRGATITSTTRSPDKNKAVGGVPGSYHLTGQAFDSVPPKGVSMGQWQSQLKAQFPGMDVINERDHVHVEPGAGGRGGGGGGSVFAGSPGYDPSYGDAAISTIKQGLQAANTPVSYSEDYVAPPEVPKPILAAKTDWSETDKALAAMKPEEILEADKRKIVNNNLWKGAAQALMAMPEGAGLGKVLAGFGGGLMSGKMTGNEEVDKKMELFDAKMAQWKSAVFRQEGDKAKTAQNEALNEANTLNTYALNDFTERKKEFLRTHDVQMMTDGSMSITKLEDGKLVRQFIPAAGANTLKAALAIAGVEEGMGKDANSYSLAEYRVKQAALLSAATQAADSGDPAALIMVPQAASQLAVQGGRAQEVMGEEYSKAVAQFDQKMKDSGVILDPSTTAYAKQRDEFVQRALTTAVTSGDYPDIEKRLYGISSEELNTRRIASKVKRVTGEQGVKNRSPAELMAED